MILPGLKKVRNLGPWLNKNWIPNPATFSPKSHPFLPLWHLQNSSISTDTSKGWSLDVVGGFTVKQGTSSLLKVQINLLYWNVHPQISPWLCVDERPIMENTRWNCHWHHKSSKYKGGLYMKHSGWPPSFTARSYWVNGVNRSGKVKTPYWIFSVFFPVRSCTHIWGNYVLYDSKNPSNMMMFFNLSIINTNT